jgi:hypothetical protein
MSSTSVFVSAVLCRRLAVSGVARSSLLPLVLQRDTRPVFPCLLRPISTSIALFVPPPPPPSWPSRSKSTKSNKSNDPIVLDTSEVNLYNRKEAKLWVASLSPDEQKNLIQALQLKEPPISDEPPSPKTIEAESLDDRLPTRRELYHLAFHQAIPFVGFGFLDNFIMIIAGDYIDHNIGITLGITTMAAAALGNTISDLCGIGSAWYIESFAARLGARPPDLTHVQLHMTRSRVAANAGRAAGVGIGCILGMVPLLF